MIIGAMKCGTSTLAKILDQHPDISVARGKEPHYFAFGDWKANLGAYHALFDPAKKIWCDASTSYTCYPEFNLQIWRDIFEYSPHVKFIYLVRDPVDRVLSNYMHLYERGYTNYSLKEALVKVPSILTRGRYYTQIVPYIESFGRDAILILDFDDLKDHPKELVEQVCNFLAIDTSYFENFRFQEFHSNRSVGEVRRHHRFDNFERRKSMMILKKVLPIGYKILRNKVVYNNPRSFKSKPTITPEISELVLRMLESDLIQFQSIAGKKFEKWLKSPTSH